MPESAFRSGSFRMTVLWPYLQSNKQMATLDNEIIFVQMWFKVLVRFDLKKQKV